MSVQDLSCWHDRRTVDNAHGRSGYLSFQQFDRATDRAEAPASVTDGAAIPSARQLGSSTDSRSEPQFLMPYRRLWGRTNLRSSMRRSGIKQGREPRNWLIPSD